MSERDDWIPVNPSEWRERYDLTVSVGMGTGTTEERLGKVQALAVAALRQFQQRRP